MVFQFFIFWKTISFSHVTSPINIIFVCSRGKHNFLASSLSYGKISHFFFSSFYFFSPHTLTVTNSDLSSSHRSLSLSNCLSSLFSPYFFSLLLHNSLIRFFFSFTDRSIAPTCKGEQICRSNYFIPLYQNPNSLL